MLREFVVGTEMNLFLLPQQGGAYVWIISFIDIDGGSKKLLGTILLLS